MHRFYLCLLLIISPTVSFAEYVIESERILDDLKSVLQSDTVVKTPVQYSPSTGNYIRIVDMGKTIGKDAMNNGKSTSIMTVITDKKGNLINTFPGKADIR